MMHSQMTEYQAASLEVEKDSLLLLAASRETSRTQAECLSLHSLSAQEGMFIPKYAHNQSFPTLYPGVFLARNT